jgi:hypothetical protein
MELRRGNLRAELEWGISVQGGVRKGEIYTVPLNTEQFPMTVGGKVYADPAMLGKGVYIAVGVNGDINCPVNAADPAHVPTVQGVDFGKLQWVDMAMTQGDHPISAMIMYADTTAQAKAYYSSHPEERVKIGVIRVGTAPSNGDGTTEPGIIDVLKAKAAWIIGGLVVLGATVAVVTKTRERNHTLV